MGGIIRSTLSEQAYRAIRERILNGELPPERPLMAEELSRTLSISPTPVKEALVMLARDGLVDAPARRSSTVRRFSAKDVREIYDARTMVECHAVETGIGAGRVTEAFLKQLREIDRLYAECGKQRTESGLRRVLEQDFVFHTLIGSLCGNDAITTWHHTLLSQVQTVRVYSLDLYNFDEAAKDHRAILRALSHRDAQAATAALRHHLTRSWRDWAARASGSSRT
jgi:DNA-binding GntR family transcriptional regulator